MVGRWSAVRSYYGGVAQVFNRPRAAVGLSGADEKEGVKRAPTAESGQLKANCQLLVADNWPVVADSS